MKIKIETRKQLEGIVYTWFNEHDNCVIKLHEESSDDFFYFTSSKLNNVSILLSMCAGDVSVGDVVDSKNGRNIMNWIQDKCNYIDFGVADLTIYLEDDKIENTSKLNFRQTYLKNYMDIKKTTPILLTQANWSDIEDLFKRFLNNDSCTKLIYAFKTYIPDLKYAFQVDLVIDKLYIYNKTLISFTTARSDVEGFFPGNTLFIFNGKNVNDIDGNVDRIYRYIQNNERYISELCYEFCSHMQLLLTRCMNVTNEEVNIYAYSNCEII